MNDQNFDAMRGRVPKGERPTFFPDPAVDQLWWVILAMLGELAVLRERLDTHERLAARRGHYATTDVDEFQPTTEEAEARTRERDALIERTLRSVTIEVEAARRAGASGQVRVYEDDDLAPENGL